LQWLFVAYSVMAPKVKSRLGLPTAIIFAQELIRIAWLFCLRNGRKNWWAGYPFIVWIEIRAGDDGATGYLRLNAEVGPISDQRARKGIIEAIKAAVSASTFERIHFEAGASD
jgi:hypothetical protein